MADPITGFATLASVIANPFLTARENRLNREWTEQQNDLAYQRQLNIIKQENEYNSPQAQMRRLMEAGLNPNLIYGNVNNTPMQAGAIPSAAGAYAGVAPQIDPLALAQSQLLKAQTDQVKEQSGLTKAQAQRIYKLTDAEFDKLKVDSERVRQMIDSDSFRAAVEKFKADLMKGAADYTEANVVVTNGQYGEMVVRDFGAELRKLIANNAVDELDAKSADYNKAIQLFMTEVGIMEAQKHKIDLENKDLEEFVNVCSRIYNAQGEEADYMAEVAKLNKRLYGSLGASDKTIQLVAGFFLQLLSQGLKFVPGPASKSVKTVIHQNQ